MTDHLGLSFPPIKLTPIMLSFVTTVVEFLFFSQNHSKIKIVDDFARQQRFGYFVKKWYWCLNNNYWFASGIFLKKIIQKWKNPIPLRKKEIRSTSNQTSNNSSLLKLAHRSLRQLNLSKFLHLIHQSPAMISKSKTKSSKKRESKLFSFGTV